MSAGRATDANFPADQPVFYLDASHRSPGDGTTEATLPTEADNSGLFKLGYTTLNELFIYGEVTDDQVTFAPESETGGGTWNYDSAEIVFGHYDVRTVEGGSILLSVLVAMGIVGVFVAIAAGAAAQTATTAPAAATTVAAASEPMG